MNSKINKITLAGTSVLLSLPLTVSAAGPTITVPTTEGSPEAVADWLDAVKGYALLIVGILAVLIIIYGGIMYMLSAGDESKAKKAKQIIFGALIGIAAIVASWFLVTFVQSIMTT